MPELNYSSFCVSQKGKGYSNPLPLPNPLQPNQKSSYYLLAIDRDPGRPAGNSRDWGDAPIEGQKQVIEDIVGASWKYGLTPRQTAHVLAIAKVESGFNPDAAAGTTTASGIGQFIRSTGKQDGITEDTRFDIFTNADALVRHYLDNWRLAEKKGFTGADLEVMVYKYHHDGPNGSYGGLEVSKTKVMPLIDGYEAELLRVGYSPSETPIVPPPPERAVGLDYEMAPGETLEGIAKNHNVSLSEILDANPEIESPYDIAPGDTIIIPEHEDRQIAYADYEVNSSIPTELVNRANVANSKLLERAQLMPPRLDPVMLDLDGDGIELRPQSRGAYFDFWAQGFGQKTAWVGEDDGLLVLDRNGNGRIDSGKELFADRTVLAGGRIAKHGFEALADVLRVRS